MKPRPFQSKAVRKIVAELKATDRTKAIMPCGTGKTLVGLMVAQNMRPRRMLVAAPSLALVKQLLDFYASQNALSRVLVVCSDDTTAKQAREKYDIPGVTTDPQVVASELRKRGDLVVFSTYQSTPRIAEAFATGSVPKFDFGLFDESHRMAGSSDAFTTALFDDQIPIAKRLFMTATPRVATKSARQRADDEGYAFASMDDEEQFGRESFYMSFNEAIEGDHLTDYRLVVFFVREAEIHAMVEGDDDAKELAKRVALVKAMAEHDIRKVLAYHRTIRSMKHFASVSLPRTFDAFKESGVIDGDLWSAGLAGSDHTSVRKDRLGEFATLNGNHRAVLSNCQVLQEGVDCPAVDGICLFEPRTQPADIVQIIGRAIRKSPGKKIANIILPVFVPEGVEEGEFEQFLHSSDFAPVLDVISALRSHDERVEGWASSPQKFRESVASGHVEFNMDLPAGVQKKFFEAITSRVVGSFAGARVVGARLTEYLIWQWMQEFNEEHGFWPITTTKTPCPDGSSWSAIDRSLADGHRGLTGGLSLFKLRRKMLWSSESRRLTKSMIIKWMQKYHAKNHRWPSSKHNGKEIAPDGTTWRSIDAALHVGGRGLPGGSSLHNIIMEITGRRLSLTESMICRWMESYYEKYGDWPTQIGSVDDCTDGTAWRTIDKALHDGFRGLPGGSSIAKLRRKMLGHN